MLSKGFRAPAKLIVRCGDSDEPKTLKQGHMLYALWKASSVAWAQNKVSRLGLEVPVRFLEVVQEEGRAWAERRQGNVFAIMTKSNSFGVSYVGVARMEYWEIGIPRDSFRHQ